MFSIVIVLLSLSAKTRVTCSFSDCCHHRYFSYETRLFNPTQTKTTELFAHSHEEESYHDDENEDINKILYSSRTTNYFLESHSPPDNERRPSRYFSKKKLPSSFFTDRDKEERKLSLKESKFQEWGVQLVSSSKGTEHKFPESLYSLARYASDAIRGTLYQQNKLDPNIVSNAMSNSRFDYRPMAFATTNPPGRDTGRLGIELDGLRYLLYPKSKNKDLLQSLKLENKAMIRMSLYMAGMLSQSPWQEEDGSEDMEDENNNGRPIIIYFNSMSQTLMASQQLRLLKEAKSLHYSGKNHKSNDANKYIPMYDNIRILCLGQDDFPRDMIANFNDQNGRRKWGTSSDIREGKVQPQNGLVMVVQPTDYSFQKGANGGNDVIATPLAGGTTLQSLQSLLAKASIHQIPTVVLSPRLTEQHKLESDSTSRMPTRYGGVEQSFYQKSSTYGGIEPPKGPTPWLLRDFIPPIFSFIGCALEFPTNFSFENERSFSIYSRVAMMQSIMDTHHPWHIFAVEEQYQPNAVFDRPRNGKQEKLSLKNRYHYMGNTKTSSGRPTRDIMQDIFQEWYTCIKD